MHDDDDDDDLEIATPITKKISLYFRSVFLLSINAIKLPYSTLLNATHATSSRVDKFIRVIINVNVYFSECA